MEQKMKVEKRRSKRNFKLSIEEIEIDPADLKVMKDAHTHLREVHRLATQAGKEFEKIFNKEIASLRQSMRDDYAFLGYEVTISLGKNLHKEVFYQYPDGKDIKGLRDTLVRNITQARKNKNRVNRIIKDFQGLRYEMVAPNTHTSIRSSSNDDVAYIASLDDGMIKPKTQPKKSNILPGLVGGGAVFENPNSILTLMTSSSYAQRIKRAKRPYDNSNYVGVELEIITKVSREELEHFLIQAKLAGSVYVKGDSSIQREQSNEVTHEITLIAKEANIYNVVSRVCDIVNSKAVGGYVNNSCGLHVHVDMRNRKHEQCYVNYARALPLLAAMVPKNRTQGDHANRYCNLRCEATFKEAYDSRDRYRALNAVSYGTHKTLELRLHSGSTNATKINNWIELLLAIANKTTDISVVSTASEAKQQLGISDKLAEYIDMRVNKFKDRSLDTRTDHFEVAI